MKILIIMGRYLPGYKDGGPVRSIKNLTDYLGEEYEFQILTCDRDHGDKKAYEGIRVNEWNQVGKARVYYVPPGGFRFWLIKKLASESDVVYVCGCFNDYAIHTLILKRLGLIKQPVVVAAMGLFSPMEFRLKYKKKKLFTVVFSMLGMFRHIYWSVTSEMEKEELKLQIKVNDNYFIAEDLPRKVESSSVKKQKKAGQLEVVWISRISPKKNLLGAVEILSGVKAELVFHIYGPIMDEPYWESCQSKLNELPPHIRWKWHGNLDSEKVVECLKQYHLFLFPTLGENYGHVIQEALSAGCAVLLSDQTPWRDLEKEGAGYTFSLNEWRPFIQAVESYAEMSEEEIQKVSDNAVAYARKNCSEKIQSTGYRTIFDLLCRQSKKR